MARPLREYDRKVMDLIRVDDFATHELGAAARPAAAGTLPLTTADVD